MSVGRESGEGPTTAENMTGNMKVVYSLCSEVRNAILVTKTGGVPHTQMLGMHNGKYLRSERGHCVAGRDTYRGGGAKECHDHDGGSHTRTRHRVRILSGGESGQGSRCSM
jgi:hypothetical protein